MLQAQIARIGKWVDKAVEKKHASAGWSIMVGSNGNRQRIGNGC
ncbi:MAG TPA: hypothetical protein VG167_03750 [Verrucomicrobiae bacterium]|nr:hypothetical protein [Verrucomicrobiae bacterium]